MSSGENHEQSRNPTIVGVAPGCRATANQSNFKPLYLNEFYRHGSQIKCIRVLVSKLTRLRVESDLQKSNSAKLCQKLRDDFAIVAHFAAQLKIAKRTKKMT